MFEDKNDEELAELSIEDQQAYTVLVRRYQRPLRNFISVGFVKDFQIAEDIVQDALLRAYLNLKRFDKNKKWKTWLYTIAINCAYNFLRKPKYVDLDLAPVQFCSETLLPEEFVERQLRKQKLAKALASLTLDLRTVLELYFMEQLSLTEVSDRLGQPEKVIRKKIIYAKSQLALAWHGLDYFYQK